MADDMCDQHRSEIRISCCHFCNKAKKVKVAWFGPWPSAICGECAEKIAKELKEVFS